jgi:hypothetical protein
MSEVRDQSREDSGQEAAQADKTVKTVQAVKVVQRKNGQLETRNPKPVTRNPFNLIEPLEPFELFELFQQRITDNL